MRHYLNCGLTDHSCKDVNYLAVCFDAATGAARFGSANGMHKCSTIAEAASAAMSTLAVWLLTLSSAQ
jgi:hypothetical protein